MPAAVVLDAREGAARGAVAAGARVFLGEEEPQRRVHQIFVGQLAREAAAHCGSSCRDVLPQEGPLRGVEDHRRELVFVLASGGERPLGGARGAGGIGETIEHPREEALSVPLQNGVARPLACVERRRQRRGESQLGFVGSAQVFLDFEDVQVGFARGERILLRLGGGQRAREAGEGRVGLAGLSIDGGEGDHRFDRGLDIVGGSRAALAREQGRRLASRWSPSRA